MILHYSITISYIEDELFICRTEVESLLCNRPLVTAWAAVRVPMVKSLSVNE